MRLAGRWRCRLSFLLSRLIELSLADRMPVHAHHADVAELADAQASGACGLKLVEVRVLSSAFGRRFLTSGAGFIADELSASSEALWNRQKGVILTKSFAAGR